MYYPKKMAELRIRIELQRPSKGIEMPKLKELAEEAQKLLKSVAEDVGIADPNGVWVAEDFYNQGLGFNGVYRFTEIDIDQVGLFVNEVQALSRVGEATAWGAGSASPETIVQYAVLSRIARDGESVRLGFPDEQNVVTDWQRIDKSSAEAIIEHFDSNVEYRGMLQGRIHSIFKESNPSHFTIRDFASGALIKCEYKPDVWPDIHRALERRDGVVVVAGWIRAKRLGRVVELMRVERIRATSPMNADQLERFFGSAPGLTGDLTTDQFIESQRDDDEV